MKIDLEHKNPDLKVGDLKLGDVFQVKTTGVDYYMIIQLYTPHVFENSRVKNGCAVVSLNTNQVMQLDSNLPVVIIPDAVITNKGK